MRLSIAACSFYATVEALSNSPQRDHRGLELFGAETGHDAARPRLLTFHRGVERPLPTSGEKDQLGTLMVRIRFEPHKAVSLHLVHQPLHGLTAQPHVTRDVSDW